MIGLATPAPEATAVPNGNVLYFGDSFTANPDGVKSAIRGFVPEVFEDYPSRNGCLQAPDNAPRQLDGMTPRPVTDYSCNAETSRSTLDRIEQAIQAGDLHPGTSNVVLAAGLNNYNPFELRNEHNVLNPPAVREGYLADTRRAAERIRQVASGARIILAGSLSIADPNTTVWCAINVVPNLPAGIPLPVLRDAENWHRGNQIEAARQVGATYVEVKDGSAGNNTCAPDQQRYVAGVIDTTTPHYNMTAHPSRAGSNFIARQIAGALQ